MLRGLYLTMAFYPGQVSVSLTSLTRLVCIMPSVPPNGDLVQYELVFDPAAVDVMAFVNEAFGR